jgi:hypothetical protein
LIDGGERWRAAPVAAAVELGGRLRQHRRSQQSRGGERCFQIARDCDLDPLPHSMGRERASRARELQRAIRCGFLRRRSTIACPTCFRRAHGRRASGALRTG